MSSFSAVFALVADADGGEEVRERGGADAVGVEADEARHLGERDRRPVRAREHRDRGAELVERRVEVLERPAGDDGLGGGAVVERAGIAPADLLALGDPLLEPERRAIDGEAGDGEVGELVGDRVAPGVAVLASRAGSGA